MPTIIDDNAPDEPMHRDEATMGQLSYINRLLESRAVSGVCAAKIINLLLNEPDPYEGASGANKDISETVRKRIEREP